MSQSLYKSYDFTITYSADGGIEDASFREVASIEPKGTAWTAEYAVWVGDWVWVPLDWRDKLAQKK